VFIEAMTFRMRGHEEASGTSYVPNKLIEEWGKKDPILRYESYLRDHHQVTDNELKSIKLELKNYIKEDINKALDCPIPEFDESTELDAVYAKIFDAPNVIIGKNVPDLYTDQSQIRYVDGIRNALNAAMAYDD